MLPFHRTERYRYNTLSFKHPIIFYQNSIESYVTGVPYELSITVTSSNQLLFRWDMVALGTEAVFVRNVAHTYACSFWAYVGVKAFLHYHRLRVVIGV